MPTYPNHVSLGGLIERLKTLGFRVSYEQQTPKVGVIVRKSGKLHEFVAIIQASGIEDNIPADVVESIRRQLAITPETGVDNEKFWEGLS